MLVTIETALVLHQRGAWEEAAQTYEHILADQPDHADALHLRGVLFLQTGDAAQAAHWIDRAIARKPDAWIFHANLAEALRSLDQIDRAINCLREAHRLRPEDPKLCDRAGLLLLLQGKVEIAAAEFSEALRLDPNSAIYNNHLGNAMRLWGDGERALAHFRRAVGARSRIRRGTEQPGTVASGARGVERIAGALRRGGAALPRFPGRAQQPG